MNTELPSAPTFGPNSAVLVMSLGILGIYAEFCRPGRVIPGAVGTALALLGVASLLRFPIARSALLWILIAVVLLAIEAVAGTRGFCTVLAAVAMLFGLRTLIDGPDPVAHVSWATASCTGVPLTLATGFLLSAAMAARRGKAFAGGTIS